MKRVVILGRGRAGKSTLAQKLSRALDIPVIELDSLFWQSGPRPTPEPEWGEIQRKLVAVDRWIIDGDLGPYDTRVAQRLDAADTVIVLDFSLWRCVWQSLRRSRETREFWTWLYRYRRDSLPVVVQAITAHASHATVHFLHNPRQVQRVLDGLSSGLGRSG
jgi:adenylate kinase family enzyme